MSDRFSELDGVLDEESWDFLWTNYPPLAVAVQTAVQKGLTPGDIRRRVVERMGQHREALAIRCENAARHLHAAKKRA